MHNPRSAGFGNLKAVYFFELRADKLSHDLFIDRRILIGSNSQKFDRYLEFALNLVSRLVGKSVSGYSEVLFHSLKIDRQIFRSKLRIGILDKTPSDHVLLLDGGPSLTHRGIPSLRKRREKSFEKCLLRNDVRHISEYYRASDGFSTVSSLSGAT